MSVTVLYPYPLSPTTPLPPPHPLRMPPSIHVFPGSFHPPEDVSTEPSQGKKQQQTRSLFVFSLFSNYSSLSSSLCCISPQPDSPCWSPSADPSTPGDSSREPRQGKGSSRCLLCSFFFCHLANECRSV